jgi:hypothetical protein
MLSLRIPLLALALTVGLVACGKHEEHAHEEGHGHTHDPLFGGALVELGDHAANLEVLLDPEAGKLTIYLLDAHATKAVRGKQESMSLTVEPEGGEPFPLELRQEANSLSGETVGDSAVYSVTDERLKGMKNLHGDVASIEFLGQKWEGIEVTWPAGEHDHDH